MANRIAGLFLVLASGFMLYIATHEIAGVQMGFKYGPVGYIAAFGLLIYGFYKIFQPPKNILDVLMEGEAAKALEMVKDGANVNVVGKNGITPVMLAATLGNQELVTALLERNANVHAKSVAGITALHMAAKAENKALAEILDARRPGKPSSEGERSGEEVFLEIIKLLIRHGARHDQGDGEGITPLEYAKLGNNAKIVEYFKSLSMEEVIPGDLLEKIEPGTRTVPPVAEKQQGASRRGGPSLSFLILLAVILVPVGIVMLMRSGSRGGIGEKPEATRPVQDPVPSPPVVPKRAWIAVDVGMATSFDSYHLCALDSKNLLYCWGDNRDGQRGDGTIDKNAFTQESPKNIGKDAWRSIAVGTGFTCGVETDGKLYCWGTNVSGQLGRGVEGFETGSRFPEKSGDDTWLMVSAGHSHACGIKADKSLFCWGGNFFGQVGVKTKSENVPSPAKIGDNTWSAVSARDYSTCGITSSSRLYCWGSNGDGVVAKTRKTQVNAPKEIPGALWRSVSLGRNHVCGIDAAKNLYCWGSNHFGQVGNGESSPPGCTSGCAFQEVPLKIGDDTWKTVAAGANTTCAINAEGRLYCWGMSVGEGKDQTTPRKIGDETWSSVSVGTEICAVRQDGDLFCWRPGKDHERRLVSGTSNPQ